MNLKSLWNAIRAHFNDPEVRKFTLNFLALSAMVGTTKAGLELIDAQNRSI